MSQSRTAESNTTLKVAAWLCLVFGAMAMLFTNDNEGPVELIGQILVAASLFCWLVLFSRRGQ